MWVRIRRCVPAAWRMDYCEAPRLASGAEAFAPGWAAALPAALVFALSPDIYAAFCLLNCAYTDAQGKTVEDQWIAALWLYGLAVRASPAALLPAGLWLLCAVLCARLGGAPPVGMADAKLFSALALAFGAAPVLRLAAAAFVSAGAAAAVCAACGKKELPLVPFMLFAFLLQ